MPTIEVSVSVTGDDGQILGSPAASPDFCVPRFVTSNGTHTIGGDSTGCNGNSFMAFRGVTIPAGALITAAHLTVIFHAALNISGAVGSILAHDALPISLPTAPPATDPGAC